MNEATGLLRQVHPSWVQDGFATSQAFRPTPKDQSLLSVYDGDWISAEASWAHYTTVLGLASYGVVTIAVAECSELGLPARPDPALFPEHAVIDFSGRSDGQCRNLGKKLQAKAAARGWQYVAGAASSAP